MTVGYEYDGRESLFTGHSGHIFVLLTVIWLFIALTSKLLPPLLPTIIDDLAITASLAGFALTVERVVRALSEFPSGQCADELSRTVVLLACVALVILGVSILSVATSYGLFLIGVAVLGLGRGLYVPPARALMSDIFHEKRGRAFGINMLGGEIAGIIGAVVAIGIVAIATWRAAFLPLALVLVPLGIALYVLSREPLEIRRIDFTIRETGVRLLGHRSFRWLLIVYSLFILAAGGVISFLPTFLIDVHGVSFALASSAFALVHAVGLLAKPISGFLSDMAPRGYIAGGGFIIAAGGLLVLVVAPIGAVAIGGVLVYAFGYQAVSPPLQAFLMDRFPDESMAGDLGAMRTIYMLIGGLGPAYAGFTASVLGFIPAFGSFVVFYVIGAVILLWLAVGE